MSLLLVKVLAAPVLIGLATLVARRWGQTIGGWVAGLPLTSGPISVLLAVEHGPRFAADAAVATLSGVLGVAAFCVAYRFVPSNAPWPAAAGGGAAYLAVVWLLSSISFPTAAAALVVLTALALATCAFPSAATVAAPVKPPWWDLPVRMTVATALVVAITTAAGFLGPGLSGLISPFPLFASVMAIFAHRQQGREAARRLLRGVVAGSFAFAAFFVVVATSIERLGMAPAFGLAVLTALAVNGIAFFVLLRQDA
jgi:hypothetical protein